MMSLVGFKCKSLRKHCYRTFLVAAIILISSSAAQAWDHPSHMITAAIAFSEIEKSSPELIDKIGLIFTKHVDPAAFWVAAGDTRGKDRARLMFIEGARWPDDNKWTIHDRPTWHTARWAIVAEDAPPEARAAAEARQGRPSGQAINALVLNFAVLSSTESNPTERAVALSWLLHLVGDIHQPLHVSDQFSKRFPNGNGAGTQEYVDDPIKDSAMPLHMLWDSNSLRSTRIEDIDRNAQEFVIEYPRSSYPELSSSSKHIDFEGWARESYQIAVDFAYGYGIETAKDPDASSDPDKAVRKMALYVLEGISPLESAPEVPEEYWDKLQQIAKRRITLAGYRIADCILAAADQIAAEQAFSGQVLETVD